MNFYGSVVYGAVTLLVLALCFFMRGEAGYVAFVALAAAFAWASCYAMAWAEECTLVEERLTVTAALVLTVLAVVVAVSLLFVALFL